MRNWHPRKPAIFIPYCGEQLTIKQLSNRINVKQGTIYRRIQLGIDPIVPHKRKPQIIAGMTISELALQIGMSEGCIRSRKRMGLTDEQIATPNRLPTLSHTHRNAARFLSNGENLTAREWVEKLRVSRQRVYQLINLFGPEIGLDPVRRADVVKSRIKLKRRPKIIEVNGESLTTTQWAEKLGYTSSYLYAKIRNLGEKEAIMRPRYTRGDRSSITEINGVSIETLANRLGLTINGLRDRMGRMDIEEAITRPKYRRS